MLAVHEVFTGIFAEGGTRLKTKKKQLSYSTYLLPRISGRSSLLWLLCTPPYKRLLSYCLLPSSAKDDVD